MSQRRNTYGHGYRCARDGSFRRFRDILAEVPSSREQSRRAFRASSTPMAGTCALEGRKRMTPSPRSPNNIGLRTAKRVQYNRITNCARNCTRLAGSSPQIAATKWLMLALGRSHRTPSIPLHRGARPPDTAVEPRVGRLSCRRIWHTLARTFGRRRQPCCRFRDRARTLCVEDSGDTGVSIPLIVQACATVPVAQAAPAR